MLEALRGLRVFKISAELAGLWFSSLEDLAAVMCSEFNTQWDAAAVVPKALCAYPNHEERPLFPGIFLWKSRYLYSYLVRDRRLFIYPPARATWLQALPPYLRSCSLT